MLHEALLERPWKLDNTLVHTERFSEQFEFADGRERVVRCFRDNHRVRSVPRARVDLNRFRVGDTRCGLTGDTLERGPTRTVVATPQELKIFGELRDTVRTIVRRRHGDIPKRRRVRQIETQPLTGDGIDRRSAVVRVIGPAVNARRGRPRVRCRRGTFVERLVIRRARARRYLEIAVLIDVVHTGRRQGTRWEFRDNRQLIRNQPIGI